MHVDVYIDTVGVTVIDVCRITISYDDVDIGGYIGDDGVGVGVFFFYYDVVGGGDIVVIGREVCGVVVVVGIGSVVSGDIVIRCGCGCVLRLYCWHMWCDRKSVSPSMLSLLWRFRCWHCCCY